MKNSSQKLLMLCKVLSISFLGSFLVSVLYSKAKLASACGGIIYFLSYVPYMYVAIREEVAHDKITAFEKCIAVWRLPMNPFHVPFW